MIREVNQLLRLGNVALELALASSWRARFSYAAVGLIAVVLAMLHF
ncbi:MAG: hypothetical protein E6907_02625 [Limosilactobacillus vaginalis]|nr:hypothetical protein [Limosilactobacillus vaginalis]